jgi:hypothetical protein
MRLVVCIVVTVCAHLHLMSMEHNYENSTTTYLHSLCTMVLDHKILNTEKVGRQCVSIRTCLKALISLSNVSDEVALSYMDRQQPETNVLLCEAAKLLAINGGVRPLRKLTTLHLNKDVEKLIAQQVVADEILLLLTGCYQSPSRYRFITDSGQLLNVQIAKKEPARQRKLSRYNVRDGSLCKKKFISYEARCFIVNGFDPYACTLKERKTLHDHGDWPHNYVEQNMVLPCGKNVLLPNDGGNNVMIINRSPLALVKKFALDEPISRVYPSMQNNVLLHVGEHIQLLSLEGNPIFREPEQNHKKASIEALQLANGRVIIVRGIRNDQRRSFFNICWQNYTIYNPTEQPALQHKTNFQKDILYRDIPLQLAVAGANTFCLVHKGGLELVDSVSNTIHSIQLPKSFNASMCEVANFGENIALIDKGHILLFRSNGALCQKIYLNFFNNLGVYQNVCHNNHGLVVHQEVFSTRTTVSNVLSLFKTEPPVVNTLEEAYRLTSGKLFYTSTVGAKNILY